MNRRLALRPKAHRGHAAGGLRPILAAALLAGSVALGGLPARAQECAYVGNQVVGTVRILSIPDGRDLGTTPLANCTGFCQLNDLAVTPSLEVFVSQFDNRLWIVDGRGDGAPATTALPGAPTDVALSPDNSSLYVVALATAEIAVIDVASRAETGRFAVPSEPYGLAVSPDGNQLVTTSRNQGAVFILDSSNGSEVRSTEIGGNPSTVALSPSGDRAFAAAGGEAGAGTVTVVEVATGEILDTFAVGNFPTAIAVSADGQTAYVANRADNTVSVIDIAGDSVSSIDVGSTPVSLALTSAGILVVANLQGGDLSLIDTQNGNAALSPIDAGVSPYALAVAACPETSTTCVGDCNGNGEVAINELILGVNISLRTRDISDCPAFDSNDSGQVEISELIRAVNNSLGSCPS